MPPSRHSPRPVTDQHWAVKTWLPFPNLEQLRKAFAAPELLVWWVEAFAGLALQLNSFLCPLLPLPLGFCSYRFPKFSLLNFLHSSLHISTPFWETQCVIASWVHSRHLPSFQLLCFFLPICRSLFICLCLVYSPFSFSPALSFTKI